MQQKQNTAQTSAGTAQQNGKSIGLTKEQRIKHHITQALDAMIQPGQVVELRVLGAFGNPNRTDSGYFDDMAALVEEAYAYNESSQIYITPNPVVPEALARATNRMRERVKNGETTTDGMITKRTWFLIDADPIRITGISSTDEEHQTALDRIDTLVAYLAGLGWSEPITGDSGNGGHADFAIDLPETPESTSLLQKCLQALSQRFTDDKVKIDTSVFNAARIWKLYGTKAIKGEDTKDRPHRYSRILSKPEITKTVSLEQLQALASEVGSKGADKVKQQ